MLKLGLESGSEKVLNYMGKGVDLNLISHVLNTLKKAKIGTYIYLLFGTPSEDLYEAEKTLDFITFTGDKIDFLNLSIFNLPFCKDQALSLETKDFYEGDLTLYKDFIHPKGWGRGEVRRFLDKEFKKHPVLSRILKRNPPLFTSNHAPFFLMDGKD